MPMIKVIIFDADGPLYFRTGDVASKIQKLLENYGFTGDVRVFSEQYDKEKYVAYAGDESPAKMFQNVLSSIGVNSTIEEAKEFGNKFDEIYVNVTATPDALATLKQLKSAEYQTCVLTDSYYHANTKWPMFERIGLKQYLDDMVISIDIKQLKSTPEAYQACLDRFGVSADEAVFVGHQQYEMDGAKAANVTSIAILPIATPNIKADYTIDNLSELPDLLEKINNN